MPIQAYLRHELIVAMQAASIIAILKEIIEELARAAALIRNQHPLIDRRN